MRDPASRRHHPYLPWICFLLVSALVWGAGSPGEAQTLAALHYDVVLRMDGPNDVSSEKIDVERLHEGDAHTPQREDVYLERFALTGDNNHEIPPAHLVVTTPYIEATLDSAYRFLLLRNDQASSWFSIGLQPQAAYSPPGTYTGQVPIAGLDWKLELTVQIQPFVRLDLPERSLHLDIRQPTAEGFYKAEELRRLTVDSNHSSWEVAARLEKEKLLADSEHELAQRTLSFRPEIPGKPPHPARDIREGFFPMETTGETVVLTAAEHLEGKTAVRFALDLGKDWCAHPAGSYEGTIVFTALQTVELDTSDRGAR